jgi:hypothetical protein
MHEKGEELLREHTEILLGIEPGEILDPNDPDLLRMEEIMEEIKKLELEN